MIREGFIAREGYKLVSFDYSQMELRLWAFFSGDPVMKEVYRKGGDIHQTTADALGVGRDAAKSINFGLTYGMGAKTLKDYLEDDGIEVTYQEARRFIEGMKQTYPNFEKFFFGIVNAVKTRGWIKSPFGRVHHLRMYNPPIKEFLHGRWRIKNDNSYSMPNRIIQGTAADIVKIAVSRINPFLLNKRSALLLQIHDELLTEIYIPEMNICSQITNRMEDFPLFNPPVKIDAKVGNSWEDLKEME